jgi:hypothetical protein
MRSSSTIFAINDIPILYSPGEERKTNIQIELETFVGDNITSTISIINQIIFDILTKRRNPATMLYYMEEQMLMHLCYDEIYAKFSNRDYMIIITYHINDTSTVSIKTQHKTGR